MQWTKTSTPVWAGIKEQLLTVWWRCAKQLSEQICVDESQFPEHLHFLSVCNRILNVSSNVCVLRSHHTPPAFAQAANAAAILLEGLEFSSYCKRSRQGHGRWMHRWPADTSREARLRQMSPVTLPNPAAQRSTVGLSWNQRRRASPQITRDTGPLKNNLLVMLALVVSDRRPLFCFLPVWALFNWKQTSDYLAFKDIPGLAFRCRKEIMESIQPLGVLLSS